MRTISRIIIATAGILLLSACSGGGKTGPVKTTVSMCSEGNTTVTKGDKVTATQDGTKVKVTHKEDGTKTVCVETGTAEVVHQ